jgi:EAL domain-containing protein (putative c-di-GMP-specific phosphodiesterase class I)
MRVEHKDLGSIHPELFFLACERKGLTSRADRTVLRKALESSMPWIHDVPQCMGIAVNFGPQTLLEAGFVPWLEGVLGELGVPRNWLQIEITEHALVAGSGPLAGVLGDLRSLGVGTYLDDFGAGFSSLGLLPHLPIAGIKCDRNLLQGAADDPARHVILEKICQMAGAMGIGTTVEGIETQEDLDVVRACGATGGQGYLLGRPMPPADVSAWVSAYANPEKLRGVALQCAPV